MTTDISAEIAALYRYPVKGLSPERLRSVAVTPGETVPCDRIYAIEAGGRTFDPSMPRHLPKTHFLMLMRDERLALLDTRFDDASHRLTIGRDGAVVAEARLDDPQGRKAIEAFFTSFMGDALRGAPCVVSASGHSFSDRAEKCISIINLASVREIGRVAGREVAPLRFRANVYIDGLAPWAEFDWVGREIVAGDARLAAFARIRRCAATNVDPASAARDMDIPRLLMQAFGHAECGIYATVRVGGTIAEGLRLGPAL